MTKSIIHPDVIAGRAAARTNSGQEIVIDWNDADLEIPYADKIKAKELLVMEGIAEKHRIANGYGGRDTAYYKL